MMLRCTRQTRTVPLLVRGAARKAPPKPIPEQPAPNAAAEPTATPGAAPVEKEDVGWNPSQRWAVSPNEVRKRTMWESWAALPANQRLAISLGICGFAVAGMYATDLLEENLPAQGSEAQPGRKAGLGD
ncbi:hypothetical protein PENSPDRAFT_425574 [Peniophora sp. CONT]|nr:hypothetical protein PENSPDRAFT_425574 [Peniophora sp. CONT]